MLISAALKSHVTECGWHVCSEFMHVYVFFMWHMNRTADIKEINNKIPDISDDSTDDDRSDDN